MTFKEFGEIIESKPAKQFKEFGEIVEKGEPSKDETFAESYRRNILRSGARAAESIAGIPGAARQLGESIPYGLGALAKKLGVPEEIIDKSTKLTETLSPFKGLKSQEEIKEITSKAAKLTGKEGYLEPKGAVEKFSDDAIDFIAPMLAPIKGINALDKAKKIGTTVLKGLGATGIGKTVEGITGSEGWGKGAQAGSYLLMSMINPKGMTKYLGDIRKKAEEMIPDNAFADMKPYKNELSKIKHEINLSGSPSDQEKKIVGKINEIINNFDDYENPIRLLKTKTSINSDLSSLMKDADRSTRRYLKGQMKRLSGITKGALKEYGKENPEFWDLLEASDNGFAVKSQSEFIKNNIEKALSKSKYPKIAAYGLGHLIPIGAGKAGLVAAPSYYTGRFLYRYAKSPTLRKYYNQMIKEGSKGNVKGIKFAADNLERELEKKPLKSEF